MGFHILRMAHINKFQEEVFVIWISVAHPAYRFNSVVYAFRFTCGDLKSRMGDNSIEVILPLPGGFGTFTL